MPHDSARRGFCADIARRLSARSLADLRALDRALQVLERDDETDDSPLACVMRDAVRDIEADERADDEAHERARDGMVPRRAAFPLAPVTAAAGSWGPHTLETVSIGNVPGDGGEPYPLPSPAPTRHLALVDELALRRAEATDPRCPGCGEAPPAHCHCGDVDVDVDAHSFDPAAEFAQDQHLTPGDAEEPIGVQMPDYDFEGGAG